jgi:DNA-binding HxlR family transcriptional regulator
MDRPAEVTTVFIGKWTVKIAYLLKERPHRHGELRRRLGGISQRMLTKTLRNLEFAGLVARHVRQSKPLAVEYSLTKLGRSFLVPLGSICRWADRHNTELSAVVQLLEIHKRMPR